MSVICFFDTETDGLTDRRLVQLGMVIDDREGNTRATLDIIIKPDGFVIPDEVAAIHGITTEIALAYGVPLKVAISAFNNLIRTADIVVGHNVAFDCGVMRGEFTRIQQGCALDTMGIALTTVCTAAMATPICKMPPSPKMLQAGRRGFKMPKLSEAYEILFGERFANAHTAIADVMACRRIYRHLDDIATRQMQETASV